MTRRQVLQTGVAGAAGGGLLAAGVGTASADIDDLPAWRYTQNYAVAAEPDTPRFRRIDSVNGGVRDVGQRLFVHTSRGLSHVNTRLPDPERVVADECADGPGVQHRFVAVTMSYGRRQEFGFDTDEQQGPAGVSTGNLENATGPLTTSVEVGSTACGPVSFAVNNAFRGKFDYDELSGDGSPVVDRQGADATADPGAIERDVDRFASAQQVVNPELPTDEAGLLAIANTVCSGAGIVAPIFGPTAVAAAAFAGGAIWALGALDRINQSFPGAFDVREDGIDIGPRAPRDGSVLLSFVDFTVTVPPNESTELMVEHRTDTRRLISTYNDTIRTGYARPSDDVIERDDWTITLPPLGLDDDPTATVPSIENSPAPPEPEIRFTVEKGSDNEGRSERRLDDDDEAPHHADLESVGDTIAVGPLSTSDGLAFVASETDPVTFEAQYGIPDDRVAMVRWDLIKDIDQPRPVHRYESTFTRTHDSWTNVGRDIDDAGDELSADTLDYSSADDIPNPAWSAFGPGRYTAVLTVQTERGAKGTAEAAFRVDDEIPTEVLARIETSVDVLDPADDEQELALDGSESELPEDAFATAFEWRLWPRIDGEPSDDVTQLFGETVEDALDGVSIASADDLAVELTVWASGRHSSDGALENAIERDREAERGSSLVNVDDTRRILPVEAESEPDAAFDVRTADPGVPDDRLTDRTEIIFDASPTQSDGDPLSIARRHRWTFEKLVEDATPQERGAARALDEELVEETFHRPAEPLDTADLDPGELEGPAPNRSITEQLDPGEYRVTLQAVDVPGGSDTAVRRVTVEDASTLDVTIERVDGGPEMVPPGEEVRYAAVVAEEGNFEYVWRGDVSGDGPEVSFGPPEMGEYRLEVEVTEPAPEDDETDIPPGRQFRDESTEDGPDVPGREGFAARTVVANTPPTVTVDAPDRVDPEQSRVSLTARVEDPDEPERFSYEWDGDVPKTTQDWNRTEHTYHVEIGDRIGTFVAEVAVTDRLGGTDTATHEFTVGTEAMEPSVQVTGPAEVSLAEDPTPSYFATAWGDNGGIVDYTWRLDGEAVGDDRQVTVPFERPGERTVSVTVEDEAGFRVTEEKTVNVVGSADDVADAGPVESPGGPFEYTLTVEDSAGNVVGSTSVIDGVDLADYGERLRFGTVGDFSGDGDHAVVDYVRTGDGRTVENWSTRDLGDYTQTRDGGGAQFSLVDSPTADGSRALEMFTAQGATRYTSDDDLLSLGPDTTVKVDLRHQTDNSSTFSMRSGAGFGMDADGRGGISVHLVNPGNPPGGFSRTAGADLRTPNERSRIEFTPDLKEFYTYTLGIEAVDGLPWVTSTDGDADADVVAGDALDLRVFRCSTAEARADLGTLTGVLEVDFDWTVEAEGWFERPEMLVIEDGETIHNAGGTIEKEPYSTTDGSTDVRVPVDGEIEIVFRIVPSNFCGNFDHYDTFFEVRNIEVTVDDGEPGLAAERAANSLGREFTQRHAIDPLTRDETVGEFYGWNDGDNFSVNTPGDIARNDRAELFVYDGPNGPSLVLILDYRGSGSATVDLEGVPAAADWVVTDDPVGGPTDTYDGTDRVTWNWSPNRSDGGALRGGFDGPFAVTVDVESASGLVGLDVLSGRTDDASDPERLAFDVDEPVTIRRL